MSSIWPCGELPLDWRRPELEQIKELGYSYENPHEIRTLFEQKICEFTGSPFCVVTQSCTDALELCLRLYGWTHRNMGEGWDNFEIPSRCYVSVPMMISSLENSTVNFREEDWSGAYNIKPTKIWDCAPRFTTGMFIPGQLQCLSFQIKKILPIGRGGAILTDNPEVARWFRLASYDGRDLNHPDGRWQNEFEVIGRHCYLSPEDCARGLLLFDKLMKKYPDGNIPDCQKWSDYPDLSQAKIFK